MRRVLQDCTKCPPLACGDGICAFPYEYGNDYTAIPPEGAVRCQADCGARKGRGRCGDGVCTGRPAYNELCSSCPFDCGACDGAGGFCGDGICGRNETLTSCARDCSSVSTVPDWCVCVCAVHSHLPLAAKPMGTLPRPSVSSCVVGHATRRPSWHCMQEALPCGHRPPAYCRPPACPIAYQHTLSPNIAYPVAQHACTRGSGVPAGCSLL